MSKKMNEEEKRAVYYKHEKKYIDEMWAQGFNYIVWGGLSFLWLPVAIYLGIHTVNHWFVGFIIGMIIYCSPVLVLIPKPTRIFFEKVSDAPYKIIRKINKKREDSNEELRKGLGI